MVESIMMEKSEELALSIVTLCNEIKKNKKEYVLSDQLLRAGTSIGANIHESKYAQSKADFISKMQIALKECYETEYWLGLLYDTKYITDEDSYKKLLNKFGSVRCMLISSINTSKKNK